MVHIDAGIKDKGPCHEREPDDCAEDDGRRVGIRDGWHATLRLTSGCAPTPPHMPRPPHSPESSPTVKLTAPHLYSFRPCTQPLKLRMGSGAGTGAASSVDGPAAAASAAADSSAVIPAQGPTPFW